LYTQSNAIADPRREFDVRGDLRLISIPVLVVAVALIGAAAASTPPTSYSLDRVVLGSTMDDAVRILGKPDVSSSPTFQWTNASGGTDLVVTDSDGHITLIDVIAGAHERREIKAAGFDGVLGETGHVNFEFSATSNVTSGDSCGAGLIGAPCIAYSLPGGVELIANFGKDNGLADWALSELVLGKRDLLLASGRVIAGK
jgi:hypothetical protein